MRPTRFMRSLSVFLPTPSARRATAGRPLHHPRPDISTHALREEGDVWIHDLNKREGQFLPTPSARRATARRAEGGEERQYFYPRPPRGGRRLGDHRLSAGLGDFYPRPPRGGRQHRITQLEAKCKISTHALREEGDRRPPDAQVIKILFLPTPSARRATMLSNLLWKKLWKFLPTPSARRATIHNTQQATMQKDFYPRPPRGGRPSLTLLPIGKQMISTHALREEGDSPPA